MTAFNYVGLLVVATVAVAAPIVAELVPRGAIPPVALEVVAGVVIGPEALGWVSLDAPVQVISTMGLGFLLFLAGMELETDNLRSADARNGALAFVGAVAVAVPLAFGLRAAGAKGDVTLVALSLTSTSIGVLIPVLKDAREGDSQFGQAVLVAGSVGEFASLLVLTLAFAADRKSAPVQVLYVLGLLASGTILVFLVRRWWASGWFRKTLLRFDESSSQLRVRASFVLLLVFVALVSRFGLDSILGAFVAGNVLRGANQGEGPVATDLTGKLNAIGFGFLIPVFFIATGVKLDMRAVLTHGRVAILVPLFLVAMVMARGATSALLFRLRLDTRPAIAAGALQATSLTFPIVAAALGTDLGLLGAGTSAALVAAGLLSVIVFPAVALALRPWSPMTEDRSVPAPR